MHRMGNNRNEMPDHFMPPEKRAGKPQEDPRLSPTWATAMGGQTKAGRIGLHNGPTIPSQTRLHSVSMPRGQSKLV